MTAMVAVLLAMTLQAQEEPEYEIVKPAGLHVGLRAIGWWPVVDGHASVDNGIEGTNVRFDDDLGIDRRESVGWYELSVIPGGFFPPGPEDVSIHLRYLRHRWSKGQVLEGDEVFQGSLFPAGTPVQSSVEFREIGVDLVAHSVSGVESDVTFDSWLGLHHLMTDVQLRGPSSRESEEVSALVFGGGLGAKWAPDPVFQVGVVLGGYYGGNSNHGGSSWDGSAFLKSRWGRVTIEAGYRATSAVMGGTEEENVDLRMYGPWASLSVWF